MKIDPQILSKAAHLYGLDLPGLRPLGGMEGMALAYNQDDRDYVLKVTPKGVNNLEQVRQVEDKSRFVTYLSNHGVKVAKPVRSPEGNWVEIVITEEINYLVTAATRAQGDHVSLYDPTQSTSSLFQAWGRITGQMHHLAKKYPSWRKFPEDCEDPSPVFDWQEEHDSFLDWSKKDTPIQSKWIAIGDQIRNLPQTRDAYGLIHNDLHPMNFLVDEHGEITVIDFDVCCFHFFVKDIAIALFFANWIGKPSRGISKDAYLTRFLQNYMQGYAAENTLDDFWFGQIPLFIKHHQILLYIVFTDEWQKPNPWQSNTLRKWRNQILNDKPVVKIQF